MTERTQADVIAVIENPEATRADYVKARAIAYSSPEELRALNSKADELKEALRASRSPQKREELSLRLGVVLWILDKFTDAVEVLEPIQSNATAAYFLGRALLELGRAEEAIKILSAALKAEQDGFDLQMALVEAYRAAGDLAAAEKILEAAAKSHQDNAEYCYQRGRCLEAAGAHEEALDALQRAVELDPNHVAAAFHLAHICDLHGLDELALKYYEHCASQRPTYVNALINLGLLYEDHGEYDKAIQCYKRVLAVDPTHPRARLFLKDAIGSKTMYYDEEIEWRLDRTNRLLRTPVSDFELSVRSRNCLEKMNIRTLGDLVRHTEEELLSYKNFGETSLAEVKQLLSSKGLSLGMAVDGQLMMALPSPVAKKPTAEDEILNTPVEELELSVRSRRCMQSLGIKTIGDLIKKTEEDLLRCKNFGHTSLAEVREKLQAFGLSLAAPEEDSESERDNESPTKDV